MAGDTSSATPDGTTARRLGYRMPLESEPHTRTFMQWPSRAAIYGGAKELEAVRSRIASIAQAIVRFEPLVMLAPATQVAAVHQRLGTQIEVWPIETDDLWCRDAGPTFVRSADGGLAVAELNFNGWGNKQPHAADGQVAKRVAQKLGLRVFDSGVVGEGGGIETDGAGTLLAHESSWVNANRNRRAKAEIERLLLDALGGERMIWAPGVKGADITDYHIDALARFVKPGQVVIQLPRKKDSNDPWSVAAFETCEILTRATDAAGRRLDVVVMPEPDPERIRSSSDDFVSSYVNYYVCNGAVIGAEFGDDKADAAAQDLLRQLYPGREVVSLDIDPIGEAGGGIHCATQQQPAGAA
ncbi:agmatine deiminase family protein [Bradyrhizobium sp. 2TAF24]|uniref:agmatine deiminase family protein n=1 Tax=Bradyrhizobium sp. 2TAF24 TaxID=3233011 RepID=UPI003F8E99F3